MHLKYCFVCCEALSSNISETTRNSCSLQTLLSVVGISCSTFTSDLLSNADFEDVDNDCMFCFRCSEWIILGADLRRKLSAVKNSLAAVAAIGYQKRRRQSITNQQQDERIPATAKLTNRLAFRFGECFTKSIVLIRSEDEIVEDQLATWKCKPVLGQEPEVEDDEVVLLDDDFDGCEPVEHSSPLMKRKRGRPRKDDPDIASKTVKLAEVQKISRRKRDRPPKQQQDQRDICISDQTETTSTVATGKKRSRPPKQLQVYGDMSIGGQITPAITPGRKRGRQPKQLADREALTEETPDSEEIRDANEEYLDEHDTEKRIRTSSRKKMPVVKQLDLSGDSDVEEASEDDFRHSDDSPDESESSESDNENSDRRRRGTGQRGDDRRFPCGKCKKTWPTIKQLTKHISNHRLSAIDRPYGCAICPTLFTSAAELKNHLVYYKIAKGQKTDCLLCEASEDLPVMVGHYFKEHGLDFLKCKYFGCVRCSLAFKSTEATARSGFVGPDDLQAFRAFAEEHRNCTAPEEPNVLQQCQGCSETRFTAAELISHEVMHFPANLYCTLCDFEFQIERQLKKHHRMFHGKSRRQNGQPRQVRPRLPDQDSSLCSHFNYEKNRKIHLNKHMKKRNASEEVEEARPVAKYEDHIVRSCLLCDYKCSSSQVYMDVHQADQHNLRSVSHFDDVFFHCSLCLALFEPSDPSELLGRFRYKDIDKLKQFAAAHKHCNGLPASKFTCPKCQENFQIPKLLFKHMADSHQEDVKKYPCRYCPSEFQSNIEYLQHLRQEHVDRIKLKCQCYKCGKQFLNLESLQSHLVDSFKLLNCSGCDENFKGADTYWSHECILDQVPEPKEAGLTKVPPHSTQLYGGFPCFSCKKAFGSVALLSLHFQECHDKTEAISFNCDICSAVFNSSETRQQQNSKEFFFSTGNGVKHPDFTSLCMQHWKTCISNPAAPSCCRLPEPLLECYNCHEVQASPQSLAAHINEHHGAAGVLQCPGCTLIFEKSRELEHHLIRDHCSSVWSTDRYFCFVCNAPFQHDDPELEQGVLLEKDWPRFHAFAEQHFQCKAEKVQAKCKFCPSKLHNTVGLFSHEIRIHTKNFKHYCEECGKGFSEFSILNLHKKRHEEEKGELKKPTCEVCGQAFAKKSTLKEHMGKHQGPPSYVCQHCGKRFYRKCHLKTHETGHFAVKPAEPTFPCPICGKLFHLERYMKYHIQYTHNKRQRLTKGSSAKESSDQSERY